MTRRTFGLMVYWLVAVAAVALLTLWAARVSHGAMADCIDATCRITAPDGGRGTGCVFEISQGRVYVLTAAHVVGRAGAVQCEFWRHGHQSEPLPGVVIARADDDQCDAAVVMLAESQFGGVLPTAVPLAPRDYVAGPGETITSVGCASGAWSTGWKGHVLGYQGSDLHFVPAPANGRSGSAVFDADGTKIIGLLRARTGDNAQGIATAVQNLYRAFDGKTGGGRRDSASRSAALPGTSRAEASPVQCPGGNCPAPAPYLLPYRYREQFRNQPQPGPPGSQVPQPSQPVWPTLPPLSPQTPPALDLGPTQQKLDKLIEGQGKIAELLGEMRKPAEAAGRSSAAHAEAARPPADDAATKAAEAAKAEAVAAKNEVKTTQEQTGKLREVVDRLIGDHSTLMQRVETRLEKVKGELGAGASEIDIAKAYARDFAKEKLGDSGLGLTAGKVLGGALGLSGPLAFAIGAGLWLVSRRIGEKIEHGEPLLIQKLFDRLHDRIDDLKDRVADVRNNQTPSA